MQIAKGNIVPVRKQVMLRFFIGGKVFEDTFMVLPTMGNILIGMSFFKKYSVTLDLANNTVKIPDITLKTTISQRKLQKQATRIKDNSEKCDLTQPTNFRPSGD